MSKPQFNHIKNTLTGLLGMWGVICLTALPAFAQANRTYPASQANTSSGNNSQNVQPIGGNATYPYGSRISPNGRISSPRGNITVPSVTINHGNGSTSYYYRDGSRITVEPKKIPSTGTLIRGNRVNFSTPRSNR